MPLYYYFLLLQVDLQFSDDLIDLDNFEKNSLWEVKGTHTKRSIVDRYGQRIPKLTFEIEMKRKVS